jgi:hypothetical protein
MINGKDKRQINRSAPYPNSKPLDSKLNFVFSENIRDWHNSSALNNCASYQKAKPLF